MWQAIYPDSNRVDAGNVTIIIPTRLDLHKETGFYFSDFFPLPNPSGISQDVYNIALLHTFKFNLRDPTEEKSYVASREWPDNR